MAVRRATSPMWCIDPSIALSYREGSICAVECIQQPSPCVIFHTIALSAALPFASRLHHHSGRLLPAVPVCRGCGMW
jgi:hypothetical protein